MKWTYRKISELTLNPDNPRNISDKAFKSLVKSILDFPQMLEIRPVVVNEAGVVLGGNMRVKACIEAGLETVPVIEAVGLTKAQEREFIIKDNVSGGDWDWQAIVEEWPEAPEWGLEIPPQFAGGEVVEDDYEIPDEIETDIVRGDLFEIGEHRLLCGDSTKAEDVERLMNGEKADMVISDPPYGMFLNADFSSMKGSMKALGKPHGTTGKKYDQVKGDNEDFVPELITTFFTNFNYCKEIFLFGGDYYSNLLPNIKSCWLVWDKRKESQAELL